MPRTRTTTRQSQWWSWVGAVGGDLKKSHCGIIHRKWTWKDFTPNCHNVPLGSETSTNHSKRSDFGGRVGWSKWNEVAVWKTDASRCRKTVMNENQWRVGGNDLYPWYSMRCWCLFWLKCQMGASRLNGSLKFPTHPNPAYEGWSWVGAVGGDLKKSHCGIIHRKWTWKDFTPNCHNAPLGSETSTNHSKRSDFGGRVGWSKWNEVAV